MSTFSSHAGAAGFRPESLVDALRWRADHQADRRAYTFLVDGDAAEATSDLPRARPAGARDRRPAPGARRGRRAGDAGLPARPGVRLGVLGLPLRWRGRGARLSAPCQPHDRHAAGDRPRFRRRAWCSPQLRRAPTWSVTSRGPSTCPPVRDRRHRAGSPTIRQGGGVTPALAWTRSRSCNTPRARPARRRA